jgi:hypothetical protein
MLAIEMTFRQRNAPALPHVGRATGGGPCSTQAFETPASRNVGPPPAPTPPHRGEGLT